MQLPSIGTDQWSITSTPQSRKWVHNDYPYLTNRLEIQAKCKPTLIHARNDSISQVKQSGEQVDCGLFLKSQYIKHVVCTNTKYQN